MFKNTQEGIERTPSTQNVAFELEKTCTLNEIARTDLFIIF